MRLKKMEVFGFKSFADRTVINFDEGITGIVGPNGCGKSNISDAFRWVLGEQSAKSMRGGKMHDVIFAGTSVRKPLNYAEVTISFTDVGDELPIEYGEVAITRRLHRSGESEYLLNRQPVRLKDIKSIFMDSGIGKNTFLEQGKVDQVINYSPMERRRIFEEASGILRFLERKREALRKLEQTQGNMDRVADIHGEVKKQIAVLERQAEQAKQYKENQKKLEELEKAVAVAKWDMVQGLLRQGGERDKELAALLEEVANESGGATEELKVAKETLNTTELSLRQHQEVVYRIRTDKEVRTQKQSTQKQRLEESANRKQQLEEEIRALKMNRKERAVERKEIERSLKEHEREAKKLEAVLAKVRERAQAAELSVQALREQQQKAAQERLQRVQAEHQIVTEVSEKKIRAESNAERMAELDERKRGLAETINALKAANKDKQTAVDTAKAEVEKQRNALQQLDNKLNALIAELEEREQAQEIAVRAATELQAREKVLARMRDEMEGFGVASRALLKEAGTPGSPLQGMVKGLFEMIDGSTGDQKGIAAALKPYSETLVVETQKELEVVVAYAKEKKFKDYSILCLDSLPAPSTPSASAPPLITGKASKLVQHLLSDTFVADDAAKAVSIAKSAPGAALWCADGAYVDRKGVVFFASESTNNAFAREAELKELAVKVREHETKVATLDTAIEALCEQRGALHDQKFTLDSELRRNEMKFVEVNMVLQQASVELTECLADQTKVDEEMKLRKGIKQELDARLKELASQHAAAQKEAQKAEKQSGCVDGDLQEREGDLKDKAAERQEHEVAYQAAADKFKKGQHDLEVLEVKEQESLDREERFAAEIEAAVTLQQSIKEESQENKGTLSEVDKSLKEAEAAVKDFEKQVVAGKKAIEQIEKQMGGALEKGRKLEKEQVQLAGQIGQWKKVCAAVADDLLDRYGLTIEQAGGLGLFIEESVEASEKQVRVLRKKIEQAGDINMTSIEEYDKYKVRDEFLDRQVGDLEGSREELVNMIAELDTESRKIFKEVFEQIRTNFRKNFGVLFRGGEADLQFTECDDILEAGIDIVAKPPGKAMRSISLLSGGEKCLTATALLFAIFEVKTSPFCILDEIDAPLDDANIDRFLNVVRQFVDQCQFIIITHNKRTMAIADQLFGVSMQEKGVSKLLSMRFHRDHAEGNEGSHASIEPQGDNIEQPDLIEV